MKSKLESTPLTEIPGLQAPLAVSSPEATALDLIAFSHRLGGMERVLEVIWGLKGAMTGTAMRSALRAGVPVTVLQRTGWVFEATSEPQVIALTQKDVTRSCGAISPTIPTSPAPSSSEIFSACCLSDSTAGSSEGSCVVKPLIKETPDLPGIRVEQVPGKNPARP